MPVWRGRPRPCSKCRYFGTESDVSKTQATIQPTEIFLAFPPILLDKVLGSAYVPRSSSNERSFLFHTQDNFLGFSRCGVGDPSVYRLSRFLRSGPAAWRPRGPSPGLIYSCCQ